MFLEKLKEHGGKIMFLIMNAAIVVTGVSLIKQQNLEKTIEKTAADSGVAVDAGAGFSAQDYKSAADYAYDAQQRLKADKDVKTASVEKNTTGTVQKQVTVPVTKTIPAVTKTVTVSAPTTTSTAKASAPAKTTTKKS
jgi:hypothetical protein